jgi:hypothetical protein
MVNVDKDVELFSETVEKFFNKAITCDIKGIVNNTRFLESMANRIRSNLHNIGYKQKENFVNSTSRYISAEYMFDECICTKRQK